MGCAGTTIRRQRRAPDILFLRPQISTIPPMWPWPPRGHRCGRPIRRIFLRGWAWPTSSTTRWAKNWWFVEAGASTSGWATSRVPGTQGAPYARGKTLYGADCACPPNDTYTFPISVADAAPIPYTTNPPYNLVFAFDPHLKDPRVYQWNVSVQQSLGTSRAFQVAYVGNKGEDLLRRDMLTPQMGGNPNFTYLDVVRNEGYSNYHALQAQFKQRAWQGLQIVASYTWAHAIDNGSSVNLPNPYTNVYKPSWDRGASDFDVRHQFSAALTYEVPRAHGSHLVEALTSGWALDSLFRANTAAPVNISTGAFAFGLIWNSDATNQRPNIVPGQPFISTAPNTRAVSGLILRRSQHRLTFSHKGTWGAIPCAGSALGRKTSRSAALSS